MQLLPDGYLVALDDPQRILHVNISEWWSEARKNKSIDPARYVGKLSMAERIGVLKAGYARLEWLAEQPLSRNADAATVRMDQCGFIGAVVAAPYRRKLDFANESELLSVLTIARPVCYNSIAVGGPLKLVREYLQKHDFTQSIADALRAYGSHLEGHTCGCCRDARFEIKMFLWLDEWVAIEPKRCWGEWLRAEYRRLPEADRTAWRRFFARFRSRFPTHPGKAWFKQMQAGLDELGEKRFTKAVRAWLAPLAKPITMEPLDSNLLRNLMWCCSLCPSAPLDSAIAPLVQARKTKETEKLLEPIEHYMSLRPAKVSRPVLKAIDERRARKPAPKTPAELAAEYRAQSERKLLLGIDPEGKRVRRVEGIFEIDGDRGKYAFDPESGRITDRESGKELEFHWSEDQAYLRYQIESSLRMKLSAGVLAALVREDACGIRLRPKVVVIQ